MTRKARANSNANSNHKAKAKSPLESPAAVAITREMAEQRLQQLYHELSQRQAQLNACMGQIEEVKQWIRQLSVMARNVEAKPEVKQEVAPEALTVTEAAAEAARKH